MKKKISLMAGLTAFGCNALMLLVVFVSPLECWGQSGKPVALVGKSDEGIAFQHDLLAGERIRAVRHFGKDAPIKAADYQKYSLLFFSDAPNSDEGLEEYVRAGGVVVVSGNPGKLSAFIGLKDVAVTMLQYVRVTGGNRWRWNFDKWKFKSTFAAGGVLPGSEVLASYVKADGTQGPAAAVRRKSGKGAVYWISPRLGDLRVRYAWANLPLANADEKGAMAKTDEGETLAALGSFYGKALAEASDVDRSLPRNDWGVKPLGAPGTLKTVTGFANKPKFLPPPKRDAAFTFVSPSVKGVIVAGKGTEQLADELAWHIGEMCGTTPEVVKRAAEGVPAVTLAVAWKKRDASTSISVDGSRMAITGGSLSGVSHGVTYLLEAMGCRYLWPGKSGKVVPRRPSVEIPDISITFTPSLKCREIRNFAKWNVDMSALGMDCAEFNRRFDEACIDRKGNRGFFEWHGVNEPREFDGTYMWGHYFRDYYERYSKTHPEFFALQPAGTRELDLGRWPECPTMCLANDELIRVTASNLVARFKRSPGIKTLSICLPDGGNPSVCMCSACRRLDPVNAPPIKLYFYALLRQKIDYVSLTDRVLDFSNRIAELVTAECPGKLLSVYVYSDYVHPPVTVKPHPSLVLLSVSGEYASKEQANWALDNISAWSRFGNQILWRPNALIGFKPTVPQNFARRMFNDLETFKVNNLVGTDFDCNSHQWAGRGLIFYALAKGHLNPDRLCYDDIFDDYCRAGFGKAAEAVKDYFNRLEKLTEDAAATEKGFAGYFDVLDVAELEACIERARQAAAGDEEALSRVEFLACGVRYARENLTLYRKWKAKAPDYVAARERFYRFVKAEAEADPVAMCPKWIVTGFYKLPYMNEPR